MSVSRYPIIDGCQLSELEIKKSRFIGHVEHTENRQQAMDFIAKIKHQHPQATHNCWAFQAGPPESTREIGCSDDGEPHGTAGKPMLNVLMHSEVGEITVVVTRYYGGVKLGTGGLARAYSETTKIAIDNAKTIEKLDFEEVHIDIEYQQWPSIELLLKKFKAENTAPIFTDRVNITTKIDQAVLAEFQTKFQNLTQGRGIINQLSSDT